MAFNSRSYHRNKAKRQTREALDKAREYKRRVAAGEAYDWEANRVASYVQLARSYWRVYLGYLAGARMDADIEKIGEGKMSHAEFMAKWKLG